MLPRVGALVEGPAFHPYLSGRANLRRLDAADRTADPPHGREPGSTRRWTGSVCWPRPRKRYRAYSLGMRQRLAIAGALLAPRDLLILDEPTNGLDPQGTREVRHLIGELAADGTTVLVSTHLLAEVEQICTHVGVMHVGQAGRPGTAGRAQRRHRRRPGADHRPAGGRRTRADGARPHRRATVDRASVTVTGALGEIAPEKIVAALVHEGVPVLGFPSSAPSLEDVFVSLTGEGFDVSG